MANFVVKNTNDSGPGSLRQAIADANARQEPSVVEFKIGSGPQKIVLAQELPVLTGPVSVDGSTQPGYAGAPLISIETTGTALKVNLTNATVQALDLSSAGASPEGIGLQVTGGTNVTIRNLKVSNRWCGILVEQAQDVHVLDNDLRGSGTGGDWCALYLSAIRGKTLGGGLEVRGNTFGGASGALYLNDVRDLTISDGSVANSQIILEKTSGLTGMSGESDVLDFRNIRNVTIAGLDLSFPGEKQHGTGLHLVAGTNVTIRNLKVSNRWCGVFVEESQDVRVLDNDLRGSGIGGDWCAIYLSAIREKTLRGGLEVRGNTFGDASGALYLNDVQDLTISDGSVVNSQIILEKTSGLTGMSGESDVLDFRNVKNLTIAGLDVSFAGEKQQGIGLRVLGGLNVTIKAIKTSNRQQGVVVTNVRDVRVLDCDFSRSAAGNNQFAISLQEITAGSLPGGVEVRGNTFGGGYGGLLLQNVEDLVVSDGSVAGSNVVLKGLLGLAAPIDVWGAWDLRNLVHENVNHLDLSFAGDDAPAVGVRLTDRNAAMVLAHLLSGIGSPHPG